MNIHTGTYAYTLLELVAISGEYPTPLTSLVVQSSYRAKVLTQLVQEGYLLSYRKDDIHSYRLTQRAKDLLLSDNPQRFTPYLTGQVETNKMRSEVYRRLRLCRMAEANTMMHLSGVPVFPDHKTDIFYPLDAREAFGEPREATVREPREASAAEGLILPAFYTSKEVKALGDELTKVKNSRFTGLLLTDTSLFVVYNTGDTPMNWYHRSELRFKSIVEILLCQQLLPDYYRPHNVVALMLGADMGTAKLLLEGESVRKQRTFHLDGTYDHFLFAPISRDGQLLLRILSSAAKQKELGALLMVGLQSPAKRLAMEHDALDNDGNPVLFAYDFDMMRILRFIGSLAMREQRGTLICMDYQAPALRGYYPELLTINTIDHIKLERRLFPEQTPENHS